MGQVLDIVPNHMGIAGGANHRWNDLLEHGPSSPYAECFDVDVHQHHLTPVEHLAVLIAQEREEHSGYRGSRSTGGSFSITTSVIRDPCCSATLRRR